MNTTNATKKITSLRLDAKLFSHIEQLAKKQNRSLNNFIETLLFEATHYNVPNRQTEAAISEARKERKNLERYADADSLIDSVTNEQQ